MRFVPIGLVLLDDCSAYICLSQCQGTNAYTSALLILSVWHTLTEQHLYDNESTPGPCKEGTLLLHQGISFVATVLY